MKKSIYEAVTKKIVTDIKSVMEEEKVLMPWQKGWVGGLSPRNPMTGTVYRGSNVFLLNHVASCLKYETNFWVSRGCLKKGAWIKKDEYRKNQWVIHFKWIVSEDDEGNTRRFPQTKSWPVWNIAQLERLGEIELPEEKEEGLGDFIPHEKSMSIIQDFLANDRCSSKEKLLTLKHEEPRAYYRPSTHSINMPEIGRFLKEWEYPMTLFHELVHATGHHDLLKRELTGKTNNKDYSCEELVAEMGATFLANICGLEIDYDNSLEYMRGWLEAIEMNPKWLIQAGAKAQKAVDLILGETE